MCRLKTYHWEVHAVYSLAPHLLKIVAESQEGRSRPAGFSSFFIPLEHLRRSRR